MPYWMCIAFLALLWPLAKIVQGAIWLVGNAWGGVQLLRRLTRNPHATTEFLGG